MDCDPSIHVTMVYDHQAVVRQVRSIEEIVPGHFAVFVCWAQRLIDRHRVADPAFGAEDAVQDALLKLWRAATRGKLNWAETEEELVKAFRRALGREVLDEYDREHAQKRGHAALCEGAPAPAAGRAGVEHDAVDTHARPPDEPVIGEDSVEHALWLLDIHDPSLRAVAALAATGFTRGEIASQLGQSLWAVEQKVRTIRAILGPFRKPQTRGRHDT